VPIRIPPLRERPEDIPILAEHFLVRTRERLDVTHAANGFSPDAMRLLIAYAWPGNVRELENLVERAVVLADGTDIEPDALPDQLLDVAESTGPRTILPLVGLSVKRNQRTLEKSLILQALESTGGNRTRAARLLEISHRALLYKLKEYGIGSRE
jgi:two-component system response regulator AtoC